jgi:NAD(P)-dependent dehydrogenase (short-subunit alcohol dehydrogenase family)
MSDNPRTTVITGGNSGIGLETAVALARLGDRVLICCRSMDKAKVAADDIRERSGNDSVDIVQLDLASFASVRAAAEELAERAAVIDVLINNAGGILSRRAETVDGFEATFGVNHLGHFLLTTLLEPQVKAAPNPRVINVSSIGASFAIRGLNFDDMQTTRRYIGWFAYCRSKLANIYFTQELARRWPGVAVNALHPGPVNTHFGHDGDTTWIEDRLMRIGSKLVMISPEKGAATSVFVATAPEGEQETGQYWVRCRHGRLPPWAKRQADAGRLWEMSVRYVADGHP